MAQRRQAATQPRVCRQEVLVRFLLTRPVRMTSAGDDGRGSASPPSAWPPIDAIGPARIRRLAGIAAPPGSSITTTPRSTFMKINDRSGASSGDHTHGDFRRADRSAAPEPVVAVVCICTAVVADRRHRAKQRGCCGMWTCQVRREDDPGQTTLGPSAAQRHFGPTPRPKWTCRYQQRTV